MAKFTTEYIKMLLGNMSSVSGVLKESYDSPELLSLISEKAEQYKAHRTTLTGRNFHTDSKSTETISNMKHGEKAEVHVMHYSEGALTKVPLQAHRIHHAVHLHTKDGTHIDSIHHS